MKKAIKKVSRPKKAGPSAKDALNDLLAAGTRLSNLAYNLVQWTGELTPETKRSIDGVRQSWDERWRVYRDLTNKGKAEK